MDTGGGDSPPLVLSSRSVLLRQRNNQTRLGARLVRLGSCNTQRMTMKNKTIDQVAGGVTVHVMLPESMLKWAARFAKEQGHDDVQAVLRQGIDLLIEQHKAAST